MRVLVTGGAGFIGAHACKELAKAGHVPVAFDNLRTGRLSAVKWGPFEHGDICDGVALMNALRRHQPDAVMHFAALAYVGESMIHPDLYYRTNVGGTLTLLEAMRLQGVNRLVLSSSCATYGPAPVMPISEETIQVPCNPYGRSKLMVEQIVRDAAMAHGLDAVALRYFNAAGSDPEGEIGEDHDPETHLIPLVLKAALGLAAAIDVYGTDYDTPDGTCVRDFVHVWDLAVAHVAALERCANGFSAFNLGTGRGLSVREVIEAARTVTGRMIAVRDLPRRPGDPAILVADSALAHSALGWRPKRSDLQTMIADAWGWMTSRPGNGLRV
jgi:UDP-arabinose 4-epimerase